MENNSTAVPDHFLQVLKDFKREYAELSGTIDGIQAYAENIIKTRGVEDFFFLKLPALGKLYDKSLSEGKLVTGGLPGIAYLPSSCKGLGGLMALSFDSNDMCLVSDLDPSIVFYTRSILYAYKKVKVDCPEAATLEAVHSFLETDGGLRDATNNWGSVDFVALGDTYLGWAERSAGDGVPRILAGLLDRVFVQLIPQKQVHGTDLVPRHGPGAVSDLRTGSDKYAFPSWPAKLHEEFSLYLFGLSSDSPELISELGVEPGGPTPPAKLLAVPKTYKGPRLITSEPTAHQFLQQGLNRWLRENATPVLQNCVDFRSQQPSRDEALKASITGEVATVDLSSASDRLSCWNVERALRSNPSLLRAINACRTHVVVNGTGVGQEFELPLKKLAGQGAATTFPIQTIIYAGCCIAAILYDDGLHYHDVTIRHVEEASRKVRVFGDDICLPSSNVSSLEKILSWLELKINWDKTHTTGFFRESCGMDAFMGYDVTPFYVSYMSPPSQGCPEQLVSWIEVSNNAFAKGLWLVADWMLRCIPEKQLRLMPINYPTGLSLLSFCPPLPTAKTRWNEELHRSEFRTLMPTARQDRGERSSGQNLLQYFLEHPHNTYEGGVALLPAFSVGFIQKKSTILKVGWVPI